MTKAELDYSRSLMAETNSILAGLDRTKIHDAVNWGHVGCTAVEKVKTFSGNATLASNGGCLSRKPRPMPTSSAPWSPKNLPDVAIQVWQLVTAAASRAAAAVNQLSKSRMMVIG
jgi:hypothetical protein